MREIQSSDAKARFAELLSDVERGESITITRHGRPIARLAPAADPRRAEVEKTMARIAAFREGMPRIPLADILSARHEGHRR